MKKKTLSIALALIMALSVLPIGALAETNDETPELTATEDGAVQTAEHPTDDADNSDASKPDATPADGAAQTEDAQPTPTEPAAENENALTNCATLSSAVGQYATVVEAIEAAETGDVITVFGRIHWGGEATSWSAESLELVGANESASVVLNGAKVRGIDITPPEQDTAPNLTHLGGNLTIQNITLEKSSGMNYIFACGYRLEIGDSVLFEANGSETSGETSDSLVSIFGGSETASVASTELLLRSGDYKNIIGGGLGQDVLGDVSVDAQGAGSAFSIYCGGFMGNVGGNVNLTVGIPAWKVYGGGYLGHVEGNVNVAIEDNVSFTLRGGSQRGHVTGDVSLTVGQNSTIGGEVIGGSDANAESPWKNNPAYGMLSQFVTLPSPTIPMEDCYVGGNTRVAVAGTVSSGVYGSGDQTPVHGNTHVSISGTVNTTPDWFSGVYGGGSGNGGDVLGNTEVIIEETGVVQRVQAGLGICGGTVSGSGSGTTVQGDTHVTVNGTVGNAVLGGAVFGGGLRCKDVKGTAFVTINAPIPKGTVNDDAWAGFGHYQLGIGNVCGVFGGTFNGVMSGNTDVTVTVPMGDSPVYGGSILCNVTGNTKVTMAPGSSADYIMAGCGLACPGGYRELGTGLTGGNATVILQGNASAGTIYGYETIPDGRTVAGSAAVIFDGTGSAGAPATVERIINADSVSVTNGAHVNLSSTTDYDQLQNVVDLTVNENAVLNLAANTHILGNYSGSAAADTRGTLGIVAGKKLIADGTASGHTALNVTDPQLAALHQVYVAALGGSTADSFTWEDAQNRFTLVQGTPAIEGANANLTGEELTALSAIAGEQADKWWLIAAPARPDPTPDPRPDPRPDPTPDPKPTPIIPVNPVNPVTPLPDEEIPLAPLPSTPELPREELPDEEVPLAEAPQTGDNLSLWLTLLSASALGLAAALLADKRRKEEQ